ncbi:MAG TPA: hypothetical protein VI320_22410 [Terracidiphilus sp.]
MDRARILPVVGQFVSSGVSQHIRVLAFSQTRRVLISNRALYTPSLGQLP